MGHLGKCNVPLHFSNLQDPPLTDMFDAMSSELVTIPPGVRPVDVLRRTHLCGGSSTGAAAAAAATGGSSGAAGTTGGGNFDQYGGFDPSVDPEMAQVGTHIQIMHPFTHMNNNNALQ